MQQRTVVVIEDEASIASAVAARLRSEGFTVEIAADGPTGLALCHDLRPDLVILDLMLPGLDGLEVPPGAEDRPVPVLINIVNPEAMVVRHNVDRAVKTQKVDPGYLAELSDDAIPALIRALPRLPEPARSEVLGAVCGECAATRRRLGGGERLPPAGDGRPPAGVSA